MWHRLAFVAESRRLDHEKLVKFALENEKKYGIIIDPPGSDPEVNTWHADQLIKDFRESLLNELTAQAQELDMGYQ